MRNEKFRLEKDSMGELKVPAKAFYAAQTQRAVENFPISQNPMPKPFICALGFIKNAAAKANRDLKLLDEPLAKAIIKASDLISQGQHYDQFPLDVFQTGSGTSTNMNANEVIAHLASTDSSLTIHPNDHVNMSQSSNDVIPTAIHLSAAYEIHQKLMPNLKHLVSILKKRSIELKDLVKTGRTHLMDAMPLTFGQELSGWVAQIQQNIVRIEATLPRLHKLALGGTAVGTGINAHPEFAKRACDYLSQSTGLLLSPNENYFEALSCQDTSVELSGHLKVLAVSLMKICNDLRWMNSGPLSGLAEIALPAIQPGSSIMPGKVNPVIPEAIAMVAAQVIGNDTTITIAGQSGNFQLNVMLPVIAHNLLQSILLLSNGTRVLADKAIEGFKVNHQHIEEKLALNPILVTALNPVIGYELGAILAKQAYLENRPVLDLAKEMTNLSEAELKMLLDPSNLTKGGIQGIKG